MSKDKHYPDPRRYMFEKWVNNQPDEFDYPLTRIEGSVPVCLRGGIYFRNGPGIFDVGGVRSYILDADGYMCKCEFLLDGTIRFVSKHIKTIAFVKEQAVNKRLYRSTFKYIPLETDAAGTQWDKFKKNYLPNLELKNTANTNAWLHGGKFLALYEGGLPHRLDIDNLETLGVDDLNGALKKDSLFSAHPRIDNKRNRFVNMGTNFPKSSVDVWEFDENFRMLHHTLIPMPFMYFILHDWIMTERYYVIPLSPYSLNLPKFLVGYGLEEGVLDWIKDGQSKIVVAARPDVASPLSGKPPLVFSCQSLVFLHHVNGWDEDDGKTIVFDSLPFDKFRYKHGDSIFTLEDHDIYLPNFVGRFRMDITTPRAAALAGKGITITNLGAGLCEFPRISPTRYGLKHRYFYASNMKYGLDKLKAQPSDRPYTGIIKFDCETGVCHRFVNKERMTFYSEPNFAVDDTRADKEDGGYLLSYAFEPNDKITTASPWGVNYIAIFDAEKIEAGPVAKIFLNYFLPLNFHCHWADPQSVARAKNMAKSSPSSSSSSPSSPSSPSSSSIAGPSRSKL